MKKIKKSLEWLIGIIISVGIVTTVLTLIGLLIAASVKDTNLSTEWTILINWLQTDFAVWAQKRIQ